MLQPGQPKAARPVDAKTPGSLPDRYAPEIVLAFVSPTGIRFNKVWLAVVERLKTYGYKAVEVRISRWLEEIAGLDDEERRRPEVRIRRLQEAGDKVRSEPQRGDALAFVAVREIADARRRENIADGADPDSEDVEQPVKRLAYVVWSIKHPDEAAVLRQIYGTRFFLFSVYAPRESREEWLAEDIADRSRTTRSPRSFISDARSIIATDEYEPLTEGDFGQDVRDAYPLADFFVDGSGDVELSKSVSRAIDIIFDYPFASPTRDEFGMFIAEAAAMRSAELGRQVGAAIATEAGDVVATGTNEVPAFDGGHFWPDQYDILSSQDNREYRKDFDTSDKTKRRLAREIFEALRKLLLPQETIDALRKAGFEQGATDLSDEDLYKALEKTGLRDITEYGRAVHGELSALMDAARRGVSVKGHTLFVTTFPCHHCTRHVVAAGIRRLVYIYPYPKSRAEELHGDTVQTSGLGRLDKRKVHFHAFLGIAPRRYLTAFGMTKRKDLQTGKVLPVFDPNRSPRLPDEGLGGIWDVSAHIDRERKAVGLSTEWLPTTEKKVMEWMKEGSHGVT